MTQKVGHPPHDRHAQPDALTGIAFRIAKLGELRPDRSLLRYRDTDAIVVITRRRPSLTCSARIGMQADAVRPARTMVRETPASPPNPSPEGRGER
jgi:hypothetical protein